MRRTPADSPSTGPPIIVEIAGEDPDVLKQLGDEAVVILEGSRVFATLDGLESDLADGRPELVVEVDREKAALHGLNTRDIDFTIRSVINGTEASKYRDGNDEYDITVCLAEEYREDLNNLGDLNVVSDGRQVPLPSVASWSVGTGFSDVRRKDLDRVVTRGSHLSLPTLFPYNLVVTIHATVLPEAVSRTSGLLSPLPAFRRGW